MKKTKIYLVLGFIVIPTMVAVLLLILFANPTRELEMTDLFREEDAPCTLRSFQCSIVDDVLTDCNYSVWMEDKAGLYTHVFYPVTGREPVVEEGAAPDSMTDSVLTLKQAADLIEPVWNRMLKEMRSGQVVTITLFSPQAVNDSLLVQRSTDMTMSVSSKTITPVKETYIGKTDYGMLCAQIYDKDLTASVEKYIMLIP